MVSAVLPRLFLQLLLELMFLARVIELTIYWVVVVRFPVPVHNFKLFLFPLLCGFLFVVLFVTSSYDIIFFFVIIDQVLLSLLGQLQISASKIVFGKFLVIYQIVCVTNGPQFFRKLFLASFNVALRFIQVENIVVFLVFLHVFLQSINYYNMIHQRFYSVNLLHRISALFILFIFVGL